MNQGTKGALFAGGLAGLLSALVLGAEGIPVLMALGDRYRQDDEYFLRVWWLIPLISGAAGFYFPFAWLLRGGCRTEDVKFLLGAIGRIALSILLAGIFLSSWAATVDSITPLVPEVARPCWWAIYHLIPVALTATGFAAGVWLAERLGGTGKTRFLRIFVWPLVGCVLGAGAIFCVGVLMFSLGTASLVLREVLARNRANPA